VSLEAVNGPGGLLSYLSPEPLLQSPAYVRHMAESGLSVPTYAYALNNPLRYIDHDGRAPMDGASTDRMVESTRRALEDTRRGHYDRNQYNYVPDYRESLHYWTRLPDWQSIYHRHGAGRENSKFVSPNGKCEAVYDKYGNPVSDDQNLGTYNFAAPSNPIGHFLLDVLPYWAWGNTAKDPTPFVDRVRGPR
jgi:hypothetical protein